MKSILQCFFCSLLPLGIFLTIMPSSAQQTKLSQLPLFPLGFKTNGSSISASPPTMTVQAWKKESDDYGTSFTEPVTKVITGSDNYTMEISRDHSDDADLKITCFAPYPLVFKTNIIAKEILQTYKVSEDASNWTYVITFSTASAGHVSCSSLNDNPSNKQLETKVEFYFDSILEDKGECSFCRAFVPPEHLELIPLEESSSSDGQPLRYLAPCRLNTWFESGTRIPLKPKLMVGGKELSEDLAAWNPAEGFRFTLLANYSNDLGEEAHVGMITGAFKLSSSRSAKCLLEGEAELIFSEPRKFESVSIPSVEAEGEELWISRETVVGYERNTSDEHYIEPRITFCQWFSSCSLRHQEVKVKKAQQGFSLGKTRSKPSVAQGIVILPDLKITLALDYNSTKFFTGLDGQIHLVPGRAEAPDEALIQLVGIPTQQMYKNNTPVLRLTCRVVNFVIAPRVYLKAVTKNGSSTILTAGSILTDDVIGRKNGFSEYRFNLELDVEMRTVECLGLDLSYRSSQAHGKWRTATSAINVSYSYAPTLKPGTPDSGQKKCLEQGSCILDCPITGVPPPRIAWAIPGEVTPAKRQNPLHLDKIGNSAIIPGSYTCLASSASGKANYTFIVELEEAALGTGPKIGIAVVVIILIVLVITFAWKYHSTKKLLGGLTPEQIRDFLKGNQEAANASEDGAERARLMEFAKFISPQLLYMNMSEKLGEGCYGVVYGGSYDSHPAAIKTFKMGITNKQIYDVLVEIKLLAYIGDHDNIVKFFGADISKLRNGQMYMVMERSTGGSLESYLRKDLRGKLAIIKQSKRFAPEVDELLKTLTQFCFDIASAMEFLEAKKIIHGDLAVRNVLLFGETTSRTVAKLTDFGYSRRLNGSGQYKSRSFGEVLLPWAYASPEVLTCGTYSTASDVWAFGVTLWEIFSLGRVPFQGYAFNEEFIEALRKGKTLPKPELVSDEIFQVLLSCWNLHPSDRPTFDQLRAHFAGLQLTHKHVPDLFTFGQNSEGNEGREGAAGSSLGGVAVFAYGNAYL